jgi:hypothetical protein
MAKIVVALAVLAAFGSLPATPAMAAERGAHAAMTAPSATDLTAQRKRARRPPLRIEITPRPLLYRQCTAWYAVELRYSGPTMVPRQRCWWVRG